jgi:hypothetical protein
MDAVVSTDKSARKKDLEKEKEKEKENNSDPN